MYALLLSALLTVQAPQDLTPQPADDTATDTATGAAIGAAIERGERWLLTCQQANGAYGPLVRREVCPVALTALATWATAGSELGDRERIEKAVQYLLQHRRESGGIYAEKSGLRVYTSGVAAQALRSVEGVLAPEKREEVLPPLELFVYRNVDPESWVDVSEHTGTSNPNSRGKARTLLTDGKKLSDAQARALKFLSRCRDDEDARRPQRTRVPGWSKEGSADTEYFTYDDVLPFVYRPVKRDHQIALRALNSVRRLYTLERNPDLTQRYGSKGFQPGTQGLFYYYLVLAKVLALQESPVVRLANGEERRWARELGLKLVMLQRENGSWKNQDPTWWENEPTLVTAYALLTLKACRDVLVSPAYAR